MFSNIKCEYGFNHTLHASVNENFKLIYIMCKCKSLIVDV
jgi:hypothetical protein